MRRRSSAFRAASLAAALTVGLGAWAFLREDGRICPGVRVGGVSVGGMEPQAALALLEGVGPSPLSRVEVRAGGLLFSPTMSELGIRPMTQEAVAMAFGLGRRDGWPARLWERLAIRLWGRDLRLPLALDRRAATRSLALIRRALRKEPREARVRLAGEKVILVPDRPGQDLDLPRALGRLEQEVVGKGRRALELEVHTIPARVRAQDLEAINGIIASFSTGLGSSSRNRRHNIRLAASMIDGQVLLAGQVFSYNRVVGPRTREKGYRLAPVLQRGDLVPGTGGGACQVSTSLYNLALLSGMEIQRRSHHSRPVPYVAPGRDAAVAWGLLDLRFQNPGPHPIALVARVEGRRLRLWALGHLPRERVRVICSKRQWVPAPVRLLPDPSLPAGRKLVVKRARPGLRVMVLREVADRVEVISRDYYRPQTGLVRVGAREEILGKEGAGY